VWWWCPRVRAGIISAAGVQYINIAAVPAPHNHFAAGPHCRVALAASGTLVVVVAVHVSVLDLSAPVLKYLLHATSLHPPHTIISLPSILPCETLEQWRVVLLVLSNYHSRDHICHQC